jgi:hypothetical protein
MIYPNKKIIMAKIKRQTGSGPQSVEAREFYAWPPTMSNAQPQLFKPGLGTHESGPRAGDIGYPKWLKAVLSGTSSPPGLSIERIEFLSRAIMTG